MAAGLDYPPGLEPEYHFGVAGGTDLQEGLRLSARIIEDLLGWEFMQRYPKHPGAVAHALLTNPSWQQTGNKAEREAYEYNLLAAISLAELFSGDKSLTLQDLTAFAGEDYAKLLRQRSRDRNDFESVISEVWIANKLVASGMRLAPILRPEGEQADFTAETDHQCLQVECKVASTSSTLRSLKEKIEKANRQFRAHPVNRPGLLVVQLLDVASKPEIADTPPSSVRGVIDTVSRILNGRCYRSLSAVLLVWDFEEVHEGRRGIIYTRVRASTLIPHPEPHEQLAPELLPEQLGATLYTVVVRNIPSFPIAVVGPFSQSNRILPTLGNR